MDTRQLELFQVVARKGSLAAAAKEKNLTPSAVSHSLKTLESHLGCRLLDRVRKKVYLNQAGELLLARIEHPLAALQSAGQEVQRLAQSGQTRLRIGASASACQYLLPQVIRELKKSFPHAWIEIESGDTPEMAELIRETRLDLALGLEMESPRDLEARALFTDELLYTFSPSHPWATVRSISRREIARQTFILYQRSSLTARLAEDYFRSQQIHPNAFMEVANIEAIKELVKLNIGVAILAPWTTGKELRKGALRMRPLPGGPLKRKWVILSRQGRKLSQIEERFCRLCRQFVTAMPCDHRDIRSRFRSDNA